MSCTREQVKTLTASRVFINVLSSSHKRSPWFSPGYEGTENMFSFLIYIISRYLDCIENAENQEQYNLSYT